MSDARYPLTPLPPGERVRVARWRARALGAAAPIGLAATGVVWAAAYMAVTWLLLGAPHPNEALMVKVLVGGFTISAPALRSLVQRLPRREAIWLGAAWPFVLWLSLASLLGPAVAVLSAPADPLAAIGLAAGTITNALAWTLASSPVLSVGCALTAAWLKRIDDRRDDAPLDPAEAPTDPGADARAPAELGARRAVEVP